MHTTENQRPQSASPWLIWADQLVRSLKQETELNASCKCYVLTDPSLSNATEDEAFANAVVVAGARFRPIEWRHPKLVPQHRPMLVNVDPSNNTGSELLAMSLQMAAQNFEAASLQQGNGQRIAGWLFSSAPPSILALHLGAIAVQALPNGLPPEVGLTRLLRFFDPLVFPALWALSDGEQRAALLGPVQQWHVLDNGHTLREFRSAPAREPGAQRVSWRAEQWRVLLCLDAFNPALISHGLSDEVLALRPIILATLGRIAQSSYIDQRDLQTLASLAIKHHPEFDRHPYVNQLLAARRAEQSAVMVLASLTNEDWQRIAKELNVATTPR